MPDLLSMPDGETIAYHHIAGESPGVLFCPGFNSDMQGNKALALQAWCSEHNRQFTRFDYYGHGESSGLVEEGTIGRWRNDTLAVLSRVTRGPQLVVGSSMGGWMMLLVAIAVPERVAGLVGLAAAPDFTRSLGERLTEMGQEQRLQSRGYVDLPSDYDDGRPYRISKGLLDEGETHLLLDSVMPVNVPVRLIHGQCDTDVPWQHTLRIAARLESEDVEVQLIKSGDHRLSSAQDLRRLLATVASLCPD